MVPLLDSVFDQLIAFSLRHPVLSTLIGMGFVIVPFLGVPFLVSRKSGIPYRVCLENLFRYASGDRLATMELALTAKRLEDEK